MLLQQQERAVGRRLLDALEQDVLPLLVQVLRAREQIDLALPFVRADIQIGAGIADELDGNGLLLGVIHDADVRVRRPEPSGPVSRKLCVSLPLACSAERRCFSVSFPKSAASFTPFPPVAY